MKIPALSCVFSSALLLAACASQPEPPAWQPNAKDALDGFSDAYLRGHTAAADASFARARRETTSTGRADLVAQVELVRCATLAASLVFEGCPGFTALASDATPEQRAYAAYIDGRWEGLDARLLPPQHRPMLAGGALAGLSDPLAQLVAAGALFKAQRIRPADIETATATASNQGWRRPLLTWLGVELKRAQAAGDAAAAERLQRRIALASGEK